MGLRFEIEPKATAILKAASDKLAAAKTLRFTAIATYESPARTGQPWPTPSALRSCSSAPTSCG